LWIVPSGATLVIIALLVLLGPRLAVVAPLFAGAVVGMMLVQALEISGSRALENWSRPVNTGLAFALGLAAFTFAPALAFPAAGIVYAAVAALVTLVVMRGSRASAGDILLYVAATTVLTLQLGLMLHDARSPIAAAGIPLLGLYAVSTTVQAVLDHAPRRAYIEVAAVTVAALILAVTSLGQR
jgi:hypothetical protein